MREFISSLLSKSLSMTIISLVLILLSPVFEKHFTAKARYHAWLIILAGFLFPCIPQTEIPLHSIVLPQEEYIFLPVLNEGEPAENKGEFSTGGTGSLAGNNNTQKRNDRAEGETATTAEKQEQAQSAAVNRPKIKFSVYAIAFFLWLCGFLTVISYQIYRHCRFVRLFKRWSRPYTRAGSVSVMICQAVDGPMLTGLFHPVILLPEKEYTTESLALILRHEFVHYKRKDIWIRGLMLAVRALHWFNPFLVLILQKTGQECELSCDMEVLSQAGEEERLCYAETIISMVCYRKSRQSSFSTLFYGKEQGMKKRIYEIMSSGKKKTGTVLLALVLIGTMFAGLTQIVSPGSAKEVMPADDNTNTEAGETDSKDFTAAVTQQAVDISDSEEPPEKHSMETNVPETDEVTDALPTDALQTDNEETDDDDESGSITLPEDTKEPENLSSTVTCQLLEDSLLKELDANAATISSGTSTLNFIKKDHNGREHDIGIEIVIESMMEPIESVIQDDGTIIPDTIVVNEVPFQEKLHETLKEKCDKLMEMDYDSLNDNLEQWEALEKEAAQEMQQWAEENKTDETPIFTCVTFQNLWFSYTSNL